MSHLFSVPAPIKTLFESFPLVTYPALPNDDDALHSEISTRKFPFLGSKQDNINKTFTLGVYNVFSEPETKTIMATDPWCMYAQFALCKKNTLGLPCCSLENERLSEVGSAQGYQHCLSVLSPFAAQDESLPVLVEGNLKRFVRSTDGMNEILRSRVNDEQLLYINMLDHVVYDYWISQIIFHLSDEQFLKLYSFNARAGAKELKLTLVKRNQFHLRHRELVKNVESPLQLYQKNSLKFMLKPIRDSCETTLLQFQDVLGDEPPFLSTADSAPTYLELKLASYVLCINNLPDKVPLKSFLNNRCPQLIRHAQLTLSKLHHMT